MSLHNRKPAWLVSLSLTLSLSGATAAHAQDDAPDTAEDTAQQAEPVFPDGSAFGMVPFYGAQVAEQFTGFFDPADSTSVTINELPIEAWDEIAPNVSKAETWAGQGITATQITEVTIADMPAIRIAGTQTLAGREIPKCIYVLKGKAQVGIIAAQIPSVERAGEDACALIFGLAEREPATIEQQLAALPYQLGDRGNMRIVRVIGGSGVLLTNGPKDVVRDAEQPVLIIASSIGPSALGQDREAFALQALRSFGSYSLAGKPETQELQLAGLPANRIIVDAIDSRSGQDVRLAQWVGFLPDGNYLRVVGAAQIDGWEQTLSEFEKVAMGLERADK